METPVSGIRDTFFRDAAEAYRRDAENAFLYRYFWQDSARELLEKVLPKVSTEDSLSPKDGPIVRRMLSAAMAQDPDWAKSLLLRDPPREGKKERRDFWQELMLNDAGYQAKLTSDTDYYIWLVRYLSVRDIFYKDSGPWIPAGPEWLDQLLQKGLNQPKQDSPRTKAQIERDLHTLAELLDRDPDTAKRLHNLKLPIRRNGKVLQLDYLTWLTARFERAALHNKIKTWLQDSGYPLHTEGSAASAPKGPRKQDFSLRLFDAFCESPEGYSFVPRQDSWLQTAQDGWVQTSEGFCILDQQHLDALLAALKRRETKSQTAYCFLPLAVHLQSGCVFFLAGKAVYEELYRHCLDRSIRDAYASGNSLFAFDYFRVNKAFWDLSSAAGDVPFRLKTTFHENAGKSYSEVLADFKRYCITKALGAMRGFNQRAPANTPDIYRWAFETTASAQRPCSQSSRDSFRLAENKARRNSPGLLL